MSVTQSCVLGRLFVLASAQSGTVNGITQPKLFPQGTSKLQWEAVVAAWRGLAKLSLAVTGCPEIYEGFLAIPVPCSCRSCYLQYPSW